MAQKRGGVNRGYGTAELSGARRRSVRAVELDHQQRQTRSLLAASSASDGFRHAIAGESADTARTLPSIAVDATCACPNHLRMLSHKGDMEDLGCRWGDRQETRSFFGQVPHVLWSG
jgi:hypothetical protein